MRIFCIEERKNVMYTAVNSVIYTVMQQIKQKQKTINKTLKQIILILYFVCFGFLKLFFSLLCKVDCHLTQSFASNYHLRALIFNWTTSVAFANKQIAIQQRLWDLLFNCR